MGGGERETRWKVHAKEEILVEMIEIYVRKMYEMKVMMRYVGSAIEYLPTYTRA